MFNYFVSLSFLLFCVVLYGFILRCPEQGFGSEDSGVEIKINKYILAATVGTTVAEKQHTKNEINK